MSDLLNLYCIGSNNCQLVTKENAVQNIDCFFIIADTSDHKIYCYHKRELETMYSTLNMSIDGIVFNISGKIYRWENHLENGILTNISEGVSNIYRHFELLDETYTVVRLLPANITIKITYFTITPLAASLSESDGSSYPVLDLNTSLDVTSDTFRQEISRYKGISRINCMNSRIDEVDFENMSIKGLVNLSGAFSRNDNLHKIKMGQVDLHRLDTVFHMLSGSHNVESVDFSQSVGDIDARINWRKEENLKRFNLATNCMFAKPVIVYLNKNSVLFNKLLVKANPSFGMLTGLVPRSDMVQRTRIQIGKERLIKGVKELQQGYFIRVDNTL